MKLPTVLRPWALAVNAALALSCGDGGNSDCEEFRPPAKTQQYGEDCSAFTYGTCPTVFDDCAEGSCQNTKSGSVCSKTCSIDADCPGALYCLPDSAGTATVCTPAASCETYCDGTTCCTYSQDPNDPTSCVQVSCTTT